MEIHDNKIKQFINDIYLDSKNTINYETIDLPSEKRTNRFYQLSYKTSRTKNFSLTPLSSNKNVQNKLAILPIEDNKIYYGNRYLSAMRHNFFKNTSSTIEENEGIVVLNKYGPLKHKFKTELIKNKELTIATDENDFKNYTLNINQLSKAGTGEDGKKKTNQDSYLVLKNIFGLEKFHIVGVFDGHGKNLFNYRNAWSSHFRPLKKLLYRILSQF